MGDRKKKPFATEAELCSALAKAEWTDWITHTPGQEVPPGFEIEVELLGRRGDVVIERGITNQKTKGHRCWHARDQFGSHRMVTRYRLRVIAEEAESETFALEPA